MTAGSTRWLIELGAASAPTGYFMHVFDDGEEDAGHLWSKDQTRAVRFSSKGDAERFGFNHLDCAFTARPRPAHELVADADHVSEDEVDDDLAAA